MVKRWMCLVIIVLAAAVVVTGTSAAPGGAGVDHVPGYAVSVVSKVARGMEQALGLHRAEALARLRSQRQRVALGEKLVGQLGARTAGFWLDQANDTVVVNVLDEEAAVAVRQTDAVPRRVARSLPQLERLRDQLAAYAVAHTAVGLDIATNQVLLRVSFAADDPRLSSLLADAAGLGPAVRVEWFAGELVLDVRGGDAITSGSLRCSAGFNVSDVYLYRYVLTAGHCLYYAPGWWDNLGPAWVWSFPGDDFGLIRNYYQSTPGEINLYNGSSQMVCTSANPYWGQWVCKSGSTTGVTCGSVWATSVTVSAPEGQISDLAATTYCSELGDSGGSVFDGLVALGVQSSKALQGCTSFFQKVNEPLIAYNVYLEISPACYPDYPDD
jgi:streptogrisin D